MRSERSEMEIKNNNLSEGEVTEIMANALEMARENQLQDKVSLWLGGIVIAVVTTIAKLSGHANIGGSLFVGTIAALIIIGIYFFARNKEDKESRKIYGLFMFIGTGIFIWLLHIIGVDSFALVWGVYCFFGIVVGIISR